MLEKKIEELGVYFDGVFRLKDGYNAVRVIIPETWATYEKKTDELVIQPVKVYDDNRQKTLFVGNEKAKLTDIMDFAKEVILNNLENESKKQLFKIRVEELALVFDTNQLSTLQNLVFKFEKPKKVKKEKELEMEEIILDKNGDETKVPEIKKEVETEAEIEDKVNAAILKAQKKLR
jgi:hypothetical protein